MPSEDDPPEARQLNIGSSEESQKRSQLAKVHGAQISTRAKTLIFSENLRRLLMPILKKKGFQFSMGALHWRQAAKPRQLVATCDVRCKTGTDP